MGVVIEPFAAVRFAPAAGDLSQLVCPPFDNISGEQKLELWARHPHNAVRLILSAEGDPDFWYPHAARRWRDWQDQGILTTDASPAIHLYETEYSVDGRTLVRRGFIARLRLPESDSDQVKPHERTFEGPKADRLNLYRATNAILSPVFFIYRDPQKATLPLLSSEHWEMEARDGFGFRHRLARLTDPAAIAALAAALARSEVMVADGHHRFATALNLRDELRARYGHQPHAPWNYTLVYLAPVEDPGLTILPTHRLLSFGAPLDVPYLLSQMEKLFEVSSVDHLPLPRGKGELGVVLREGQYRLRLRSGVRMLDFLPINTSQAYEHLDVVLAHTGLLQECLGIGPEQYGEKLRFVRGAGEAAARVLSGKCDLAVLLPPTSVDEVLAVAAAGEKMPQKSTDFFPKVLTGMVFYSHA
ncbi:DUF1015 domain-containing protein [bacterium]|nr:DUF1015 domain-containing protein [bacterium]